MLKERYTAQSPTVFNAGVSGEFVTESETRQTIHALLNEQNPEIVLLQEGINDLHVLALYSIPPAEGARLVVEALRSMSLEARGRGMRVFLGTLLPQRPNGCRAFGIPPKADTDLITPTNDRIRAMAAAEGLDLVDLFAVFNGHTTDFLAQDGLHPSDAGYAAIATGLLRRYQAEAGKSSAKAGARLLEPAVGRHHARPDPEGHVERQQHAGEHVQVPDAHRKACRSSTSSSDDLGMREIA